MLRTAALSCCRDDRRLLDRLSVTFEAGKAYQLEGPNGSGKTTLIRILAGLFTDFEGELFWYDRLLKAALWDELRAHLLYIGHAPAVKLALTPLENLQTYLELSAGPARCTPMEALGKVGLRGYEDLSCYQLSAGQKRRVALARLYLESAPLWLLDEPFTAIDRKGVEQLECLLASHVHEGGTVIVTTHHALQLSCPLQKVQLGREASRRAVSQSDEVIDRCL